MSGSMSVTDGRRLPAVAGQIVVAVWFYAKLGGQSSQVRPAIAQVLAESGAKVGPVNSGA